MEKGGGVRGAIKKKKNKGQSLVKKRGKEEHKIKTVQCPRKKRILGLQ